MWRYYETLVNHIFRMGMWEWFGVGLGVLLLGVYCMRGYGSRSNY